MIRRPFRFLLALLVVAVGGLLSPVAAQSAVRPAVSLNQRPALALPSEQAQFSGRVVPAQGNRAVVLQRRSGSGWVTVGRARTARTGAYQLAVPVPRSAGRYAYRVTSPAAGARPAVTSAARTVTVTNPTLTMATPSAVTEGAATRFTGAISPARIVTVSLQQLVGARWTGLTSVRTNRYGQFAFSRVPASAAYRVVAAVPAGTVLSRSTSVKVSPRSVFLSDLDATVSYPDGSGSKNISGVAYEHSITLSGTGNRRIVEYAPAGTWSTFTTTVGLTDDSAADGHARLEIYADGRSAWSGVATLGAPLPVSLNVAGVQRLRFEVSGWTDGSSNNSSLALGAARFTTTRSSAAVAAGPVVSFLEDREQVAGDGNISSNGRVLSIAGQRYEASIEGYLSSSQSTQRPRQAEWDLGRAYQTLTFTLGQRDDSDAGFTNTVRIYGDGALLSDTAVTLGQATPISVPVAGVLRLRVEMSTTTDASCCPSSYTVLGNARLLS